MTDGTERKIADVLYRVAERLHQANPGKPLHVAELVDEVIAECRCKRQSVLPSNHCYNRINDGVPSKNDPMFEHVEEPESSGLYLFLGRNFPFHGPAVSLSEGSAEAKGRQLAQGEVGASDRRKLIAYSSSNGNFAGAFGTNLTGAQFAAKVALHGLAGGVMSEIGGGKFGHGFVAAGGTQLASARIDLIGGRTKEYTANRIVAAAVVGGTIAEVTGGKFANGAVTGAFSRAFNEEGHWTDNGGGAEPHLYAGEENICTYEQTSCTQENFMNEYGLKFSAPGQTHSAANGAINYLLAFGSGGWKYGQ